MSINGRDGATPLAKLVAIDGEPKARTKPRPVGGAAGTFVVPETFFEPLSPTVEALFYPSLEGDALATKVAEKSGL